VLKKLRVWSDEDEQEKKEAEVEGSVCPEEYHFNRLF